MVMAELYAELQEQKEKEEAKQFKGIQDEEKKTCPCSYGICSECNHNKVIK